MKAEAPKRRGRPPGSKNKTKKVRQVIGRGRRQASTRTVKTEKKIPETFSLEIDRAGIKFAYHGTL